MVPKLPARSKGKSFRGCAMYILHDIDTTESANRVGWAEMRNLVTNDPHVAWRVMAATALDQDRLKKAAGIKNTGRKSRDHVLHFTLNWEPSEKSGLTKDEMMRAAIGALNAIGAGDRQAMVVAHTDKPHPHVHLMVNRVSPEDGRILPSSNEKLNLSKWALEYEQERGEVLCEQREQNWKARDRDEYTRGEPDKPRHIHELESANDNRTDAENIREEQRKRDYALGRKTRELKAKQRAAWRDLAERRKTEIARIRDDAKRAVGKEIDRIRAAFRDRWTSLYHEHKASLRAFEIREEKFLGRVSNTVRSIDLGEIFSGQDRRKALSEAYNALSSSGGRLEALKRSQRAQDRALELEQKAEERAAEKAVKAERDRKLADMRALFQAERSSLIFTQRLERAHNRGEWITRSRDRRAAWEHNRLHGNDDGPDRRREASPDRDAAPKTDFTALAESFLKRQEAMERQRKDREQNNDRDPGDRER